MKISTLKTKLSLIVCTTILIACGGGSNDNSTSNEQPTQNQISYVALSGTAFSNALLGSAKITAICKDGSGFKSNVSTDSQGKWTGEVSSTQFPCRIELNLGTQYYHGYATKSGNVNINPLIDVVIANASTQVPTVWYKSGSSIDEVKLKNSQDALIKELKSKGYEVDGNTDFLVKQSDETSKEYQTVKDLFSAIEKSTTIENFNALLLLLKDGNFSQIPKKIDTSTVPLSNLVTISNSACTKIDAINYKKCYVAVTNDFKDDQLISFFGEPCTVTKVQDKITLTNSKISISGYLNGEDNDYAEITDTVWLLVAHNEDGSSVNIAYDLKRNLISGSGATAGNGENADTLVCSSTRK